MADLYRYRGSFDLDLVAAYAVDAVDDDERRYVEARLDDDPLLRIELDAYREAAARLAPEATGEPAPPPAVWRGIRAEIAPEPPAPLRSPRTRLRAWAAIPALAAAAVVSIAAVLGVPGRSPASLDRVATEAARAVGASHVTLSGAGPDVDAVVTADGSGYLFAADLPRLDPTRTYQLWAVLGGEVISAGVLGPEPGVVAFRASGDLHALVLTEEVAGGVAVSAADPLLVWRSDRS